MKWKVPHNAETQKFFAPTEGHALKVMKPKHIHASARRDTGDSIANSTQDMYPIALYNARMLGSARLELKIMTPRFTRNSGLFTMETSCTVNAQTAGSVRSAKFQGNSVGARLASMEGPVSRQNIPMATWNTPVIVPRHILTQFLMPESFAKTNPQHFVPKMRMKTDNFSVSMEVFAKRKSKSTIDTF